MKQSSREEGKGVHKDKDSSKKPAELKSEKKNEMKEENKRQNERWMKTDRGRWRVRHFSNVFSRPYTLSLSLSFSR